MEAVVGQNPQRVKPRFAAAREDMSHAVSNVSCHASVARTGRVRVQLHNLQLVCNQGAALPDLAPIVDGSVGAGHAECQGGGLDDTPTRYCKHVQLIVAEKPSVARDLARVLGVRATGQHCFESDATVITWCIGHLVELDEPAAYEARWKVWRLDTLPMLPAEFKLRASQHAIPQLRTVTRLLADPRFTSVVNACDAGREGELIFRYVYRFAGGGPPVQRLWISSLTDDAIRRGFAALRPGAQLDALGDAARSRSEADWLVGMNATRALTARGRAAGHTALYSIGRVQTPTLAMLVEREHAIRAFVPRDYWEIRGNFRTASGQQLSAGWRHGAVARLATAELAELIVARDRLLGAAAHPIGPRVERVRARTVREPAPLLFDLTSLQRTANRRFGFSAARTLELAQALYERHKILTYPRTDSRHLTTDVLPELPTLFSSLAAVPGYAAFATELLAHPPKPGRRVIDDAKVHDHHAIIPTGKVAGSLDHDERRLFDLVVRRFLGVFFPDAEFAVTEATIRVGAPAAFADPRPARDGEPPVLDRLPPVPDRYLTRGRVRLAAGWQEVAGIDGGEERRNDRDADESSAVLPPLVEGQALDGAFTSLAKQTTPPHRYTEATLLGAMESAGKTIGVDGGGPPAGSAAGWQRGSIDGGESVWSADREPDTIEALRAAMKDCGLGTPATRAAIIETLLRRDYIERTKQHLVPTALGIGLIAALPVASLASAELTGRWEARLARIARGEESRAQFMADIARYVREMVEAVRGSSPPAAPESTEPAEPVGACPRCAATVVERPREFACTGGCGFQMRNRVAGRAIEAPLASELLQHRRSQLLRGFRSKAGKEFAAILVLDETGELTFDFASGEAARTRATSKPANGTGGPPDASAAAMPATGSLDAPTLAAPAVRPGMSTGARPEPRSSDVAPTRSPSLDASMHARPPSRTLDASPRVKPPLRPADSLARPHRTPGPSEGTPVARSVDASRSFDGSARTNRANRAAAATRKRDKPARDKPARDRPARDRPARDKPARDKPARDKPARVAREHTAVTSELACPRCHRGALIVGSRGWGCSRWRDACRFVIWFETAGRRVTLVELRDLVTRGKTRKARFAPDRRAEVAGRLVLDVDAPDGCARFEPG